MDLPPAAQSSYALTLAVDTNILIRRHLDAATVELFRFHEIGKVNLEKTDTLDGERPRTACDDAEARQRLPESMDLIEVLGPMRLDYSRLDHPVLASPNHQDRDDAVFRMSSGRDRTPTSPGTVGPRLPGRVTSGSWCSAPLAPRPCSDNSECWWFVSPEV